MLSVVPRLLNLMLPFETTQWTIIRSAGSQESPEAQAALEDLCRKYWQPLYEYARRRTRDEATASDSVQSFVAWLIEKQVIQSVDSNRGKFRSFLIVSFRRFLGKQHRQRNAIKRGGGQHVLSMDQAEDGEGKIEAVDSQTVEAEFKRNWGRTLLGLAMNQLEGEYREQEKSELFEKLKPFISREQGQNYQEVADSLKMKLPAVRMAASRLRERFRLLLRQEIAHTVNTSDEIEEEIRDLFLAFHTG